MITLKIFGSPAPQGSKRFVGIAKTTGRGILVESSKKLKPWRQDVKAAAEAVRSGCEPIDAPLSIGMVFTLPKPTSAPRRRRTWPMRKPDIDKLARSTLDGLVQAGLIADDARVVHLDLWKVFPNEGADALEAPGVVIRIQTIGGIESHQVDSVEAA